MRKESKTRIGIVGTGFIARGLIYSLKQDASLVLSKVLTRRKVIQVKDLMIEDDCITNSIQDLINNSDLIVECSGDPVHATKVLAAVLEANLPVVTMNSELQVTTGSWLSKKGLITEAEGDQPGSLAALHRDVLAMGFEPLVFGNIKGFLNHTPTEGEMKYWAAKSGISLNQVTSFTDGTKTQIEQALVANGLGAEIVTSGLLGPAYDDYKEGALMLAEKADSLGVKISDYVLSPKSPAGVFIVAKHQIEQASFLKYYKLGDGPYYVLIRPFHLCHLELSKTIHKVLRGEGILLNNGSKPKISVATIAKKKLARGTVLKRGLGSFDVRGEAINISEHTNHLPIGLVFNVTLKNSVEPGQLISFADVDVPDSQALTAWKESL